MSYMIPAGLCLLFIGGIALNSFLKIPGFLWLGILILGAALIVFAGILRKRNAIIFGLCLLASAGGLLCHQSALPDENIFEPYYDKKLIFEGVIVEEPQGKIDKMQSQVESKDILGRVLITTGLYPKCEYGDELRIRGELKEPAIFDDFNYKEYLAKDKIYFVMYQPGIELIAKNQGNWFRQKIFKFKNRIREAIGRALSPPESSLLGAILIGDKYALSDGLKEGLSATGTSHIAAISGMHMVIFSQLLLYLALVVGLWRGQAFYFVLIFLAAYIIMIGAPASAVRAGIMIGLLLLAQKVGRLGSSGRSIVFAATVMLLFNPLLLKSDVGFQLSFTAVLSIIYLKPILDKWTKNLPNPAGLKDILTMTLSAQIGVLPLVVYHFRQFPLISPVANLLIVPVVPFIMISGIALATAGLLYLPLVKIAAWPVWLFLNYVLGIIWWLDGF